MKEEELEPQAPSFEEQLKEHQDKYLRLLADTENTRKRLQKEKMEMIKFSVENVISEFLGPIDNFENALSFTDHMSEETRNWALGFQMILGQLKGVLSDNGVSTFTSVGAQFDPALHEAVEAEETDAHPEGTILHEFIKGYKCHDRTLRPAQVKVAKPLQNNNQENTHV